MPAIPEFDASLAEVPTMPRVVFAPRKAPQARSWAGALGVLFPGDDRVADLKQPGQPWRVLGGPGTGKTSLLADLAVAHVVAGVSPDAIAVITPAKDAATRIREEVAVQCAVVQENGVTKHESFAGSGGMVRAIHSLAFAIVRQAAVNKGEAEPALTTGAKQDAVVRKLLAGHAEDGGLYWPERLVPALKLQGMARATRDVMLRAAERGLDGPGLQAVGTRCGVEEWVAVGRFMVEYRQAMRLAGQDSVNAAELIGAALAVVKDDPSVIPGLGIKVMLVDDAHHIDPQAAQLLCEIMKYAEHIVVAGDHDQSVMHFRGANTDFLASVADEAHTIVSHTSFRMDARIAAVVNAVTSRLPGRCAQRGVRSIDGAADTSTGNESARVVVRDTVLGERNVIADFLRRQHVEEGVAWKDMVVLVRSGAGESALHRHLARAGVPVAVDPTDVVLSQQRMVVSLLLLLRAVTAANSAELEVSEWEQVLTGPLCNADPVTMSRVVRAVRRLSLNNPEFSLDGGQAIDKVCAILATPGRTPADQAWIDALPPREKQVLEVPLQILDAGRAAMKDGVESALWALWDASRMHNHLVSASLRGGATGSAADRDLDAVMTLFDFAGDLVEQDPSLTAAGFIRAVMEQELPTGARDRRSAAKDAVSVLSVHGALGREWDSVVIAGMQEDVWPSLGQTGSVLFQEQLIDYVDDGIMPGQPVSHVSERMAEERRLFNVAVSRARRKVLITAVDSPDDVGEPSRFLAETGLPIEFGSAADDALISPDVADGENDAEHAAMADSATIGARVLSMSALVAELRIAVTDPGQSALRRRQAAYQLARLAADGVAAAHPGTWWGLQGPSTDAEIGSVGPHAGRPMRVSPSKVGSATECALRAMIEPPSSSSAMTLGSMFHKLAEYMDKGVEFADAESALLEYLPQLVNEPEWHITAMVNDWIAGLQAWRDYTATHEAEATEQRIRVHISDDVVISGQIDRLQRNADGKLEIVDIKTGKNLPTFAATEENPQLGIYQLALSTKTGEPDNLGGAKLLYPRNQDKLGLPAVRVQSAQTPEMLDEWKAIVLDVARSLKGPGALATPNDKCDMCAVKMACPAKGGKR